MDGPVVMRVNSRRMLYLASHAPSEQAADARAVPADIDGAARHRGGPRHDAGAVPLVSTDSAHGEAGLAGAADRAVRGYSKGMQQRLGLAQGLVHDPQVLILDEPTAGLDPVGLAEFGRLIRRLKVTGKTILLTSHHLTQVEELCDAGAMLRAGRLIWTGPIVPRAAGTESLESCYLERMAAGGEI